MRSKHEFSHVNKIEILRRRELVSKHVLHIINAERDRHIATEILQVRLLPLVVNPY